MKIPDDFESCLVPAEVVVRQDGVTEALDRRVKEFLEANPQRFAARPDGTSPDGRNPFAQSGELMTPTMNTKAQNETALRKSIFRDCGMVAGGKSNQEIVLGLIEKILQKAGR
jgi:hypothetical protein